MIEKVKSRKRIPYTARRRSIPRSGRKRRPLPPRRRKTRFFRFGFLLGISFLACWTLIASFYYFWALTFDLKQLREMPQSSSLFDQNGQFYSRLAGENRRIIPFDAISNDLINAIIAREDARFYRHHGIDPIGIARALVRNLLLGSIRQGGSTITQQLARNSFPLGGRNLNRKLLEAALAFRMETELNKEEILEYYLNRIYFGSGSYGVETASQTYFGKPASRLNLSEAALIAGLIRSPNRLSPFNDLPSAIRQRNIVLHSMKTLGFIDQRRYDHALNTPVELAEQKDLRPKSGWALEAIYRELEWILPRELFDEGGLQVYTSIHPQWQRRAQEIVTQYLETISVEGSSPLQAAIVVIDNQTGGISAIVGGRDYAQTQFDRASLGKRQIGSTVKPFLYTLAFEKGLRPHTPVKDSRILPGELPSPFSNYSPNNADGTFGGIRSAGEGLIYSRNTMSVRIAAQVGLNDFGNILRQLNLLDRYSPIYPSACLGAFECSVKDLTAAYTVFSNQGIKLQPFLIEQVKASDGRTLYRSTHGVFPIFSASATALTDSLLRKNLERTGAKNLALIAAGGKTGTTNDGADAWFVGYTRSITCGVWIGNDQRKKIHAAASGASLALPLWIRLMDCLRD